MLSPLGQVEPEWCGGGSGWTDLGPDLGYAAYKLDDSGQVTSLRVAPCPSGGARPPPWQGFL